MLRFPIIHEIVCYPSHISVVPTLSCYKFSEIAQVAVSAVPRVQLIIWKDDFLLQFLLLGIM